MTRDEQNLEKITAAFTQAILLFPMDDLQKYNELSRRIAFIVSEEIRKSALAKVRKDLMEFWPEEVRN